jgi:hypothetical protein
MRKEIIVAGLLTALLSAAGALADSTAGTISNTKTFALAAGSTKTFLVPYPYARQYASGAYSGSVKILGPKAGTRGAKPSLKLVRIKRRGSMKGGADYGAVVRNANRRGTAPVRVRITAVTASPGFY